MLNVGENFLHYRIISAIGSGGMGEVYLAKDNQLERKVAIKGPSQKVWEERGRSAKVHTRSTLGLCAESSEYHHDIRDR
jgi:serine/threonine protein kinase